MSIYLLANQNESIARYSLTGSWFIGLLFAFIARALWERMGGRLACVSTLQCSTLTVCLKQHLFFLTASSSSATTFFFNVTLQTQ